MVSFTVIVKHPNGENQTLELETKPDTTKVWQLTPLLERQLNMTISAEIAIEEKVLVGNARLEPVTEGQTYILAALGRQPSET